MRKQMTILAAALLFIVILLSITTLPTSSLPATSLQGGEEKTVAVDEYKATFITAPEPKSIAPAGSIEEHLPDTNTWGYDSWLFMEVSVPTFPKSEVRLEPDVEAGEDVPVAFFTPNLGWTCFEEKYEDGTWLTRWMYDEPVAAGAAFVPLLGSWTMTNFRVSSGVCGNYKYSELVDAMNRINITQATLQSKGISGAPEVLWGMVH